MVTLTEAKTYLRQSSSDEDELITTILETAEQLVLDSARLTESDLTEDANLEVTLKTACLYTIGYLYEHREEADHHALALDLRSLLFGVREAAF